MNYLAALCVTIILTAFRASVLHSAEEGEQKSLIGQRTSSTPDALLQDSYLEITVQEIRTPRQPAYTIHVNPSLKVTALKEIIAHHVGLPAPQQRLLFTRSRWCGCSKARTLIPDTETATITELIGRHKPDLIEVAQRSTTTPSPEAQMYAQWNQSLRARAKSK